MVIYQHNHNWISTLFPGMIAKGFAKRMAADVSLYRNSLCYGMNNAVRLITGQMLIFITWTWKKVYVALTMG